MRGVIVNILLIFEKVPPQNVISVAIKWGNFCKAPHQKSLGVAFVLIEDNAFYLQSNLYEAADKARAGL